MNDGPAETRNLVRVAGTEIVISVISILGTMDPPRIELGSRPCEGRILPLYYGPISLAAASKSTAKRGTAQQEQAKYINLPQRGAPQALAEDARSNAATANQNISI